MTLHPRRAQGALRRRAAAMLAGVTLATTVFVDPVLCDVSWRTLANNAGSWLLSRWGAVESSVEAVQREAARTVSELRGTLGVSSFMPAELPGDVLAFGTMRVPRRLAEDVLRAAIATSVDPVYLMALADKESSFRTGIRATTSSAVGLFQFVEGTWLQMLREFGPRHGLTEEARAISLVSGRPVVQDPSERQRLLALRNDPYLSAVMAAELLRRSEARLARELSRPLLPTEWYIAHFLGTGDALRLLRSRATQPQALATTLLPAAARANRALFTRPAGRRRAPVTVGELYGRLERMMSERLDRYGGVEAMARPGFASGWN